MIRLLCGTHKGISNSVSRWNIDAGLARQGLRIGPYDTLIAAITLANHLTLVTRNTAEFSPVPGLRLEDWEALP